MIGEIASSTSGAGAVSPASIPNSAFSVEPGAAVDGSFSEKVLSTGSTDLSEKPPSWWADPCGRFEQLRAEFSTKISEFDELEAGLLRAGVPRTDPRFESLNRKRGETFLRLQIEVQGAATQLEVFGKFVEHTTSAIRTATQTQV